MRRLKALLRDSKRSQLGSVLSGVLIITLFVSIIVGALMTELSTNLMLSRALMHRVSNQATVNSAAEQAISQMQNSPVINGCPGLSATTLNNLTAATTYLSCGLTADPSAPFNTIAQSRFSIDGTFASVPSPGGNEYLVASGTYMWRAAFGQAPTRADLGATVTGPPMAMPDGATILVPVQGSACGGNPTCVAQLGVRDTSPDCYMQSAGNVVRGRPAAGVNFPNLAYFGDDDGTIWVFDTSAQSCRFVAQTQESNRPIVFGPIVVSNGAGADEIFVLQSDGSRSELTQEEVVSGGKRGYSFSGQEDNRKLARPIAQGMAIDRSTLPAHIAITFAGGMVQTVVVSVGGINQLTQKQMPSQISGAPTYCCGNPATALGVGGRNGQFYVLNAGLTSAATYQVGTGTLSSPDVDGGGDWFVGSDDGNVYEVPKYASSPFGPIVLGGGQLGQVLGSVQVGPCNGGAWLCAYAPSDTGAYEIDLSSRDVVLSACISTAQLACIAGDNPRLWVSAQVGSVVNKTTVEVKGWSYYSP